MQRNILSVLNKFSLKNMNAIVTGASKTTGLCFGMARALQEAGARITLMDISENVHDLAKTMGGEKAGCYSVLTNLTDDDSLESGFRQALNFMEGLDIVLNGAGLQYRSDAIDFPHDKWNAILAVNLSGMFFLSQIAARHMMNNGGGSIINIASMTSFVASSRIPAYSASKGGVMQLTKALSNEWSRYGIRVNAIAPGYMKTELTIDMINTEQGKQHTARIPMGRWGESEDLKGITVFLASPASGYITGAIIPVDGGYLGL